jgi:hypothetical protein
MSERAWDIIGWIAGAFCVIAGLFAWKFQNVPRVRPF